MPQFYHLFNRNALPKSNRCIFRNALLDREPACISVSYNPTSPYQSTSYRNRSIRFEINRLETFQSKEVVDLIGIPIGSDKVTWIAVLVKTKIQKPKTNDDSDRQHPSSNALIYQQLKRYQYLKTRSEFAISSNSFYGTRIQVIDHMNRQSSLINSQHFVPESLSFGPLWIAEKHFVCETEKLVFLFCSFIKFNEVDTVDIQTSMYRPPSQHNNKKNFKK